MGAIEAKKFRTHSSPTFDRAEVSECICRYTAVALPSVTASLDALRIPRDEDDEHAAENEEDMEQTLEADEEAASAEAELEVDCADMANACECLT